ncbi:MAG: hypothetical protein LBB38_02360 [Puniceicoccales bacterium]|jgi:hypothetical protein|nr:hypothetical protein [Puniceicoccales bacterium]
MYLAHVTLLALWLDVGVSAQVSKVGATITAFEKFCGTPRIKLNVNAEKGNWIKRFFIANEELNYFLAMISTGNVIAFDAVTFCGKNPLTGSDLG